MNKPQSLQEITEAIIAKDLVFLYLSQPQCSVCVSLLPKVEELLQDYPLVESLYINTAEIPAVSGEFSVFTIPTVMLFVQGKEQFRLARTFGLTEIKEKLDRVYAHFE